MFRGGEEEREKIIRKCVAAFPYMWFYVSAATCFSHLLPTDLALSLFARVWVLPLFHSGYWLLTSIAFQDVSATPCSKLFILFAVCWFLSLLARMWVLLLVCPVCCLLISLTLSLLTRMWDLPLICPDCYPLTIFALLTRLWVPSLIHPVCCLLSANLSHTLSLLIRMWVLPLICLIYCLLTSLVLPLLIRMWVLALVDPVGCLLISLTLSLPARLWVLVILLLSADLSCFVSACQHVSTTPHSWCSLLADLYQWLTIIACQGVSATLYLSYFLSTYPVSAH